MKPNEMKVNAREWSDLNDAKNRNERENHLLREEVYKLKQDVTKSENE